MSLYHELKRRNVLRVAIAYLAGSWLLVEVAETVLPLFGFDDTPARILVIVLSIGFPLFLLFSWVFEITPEGLKKEKDIDRTASVTHKTGKLLDRFIIVLLALGMAYFAFDKFVLDPVEDVQIAKSAHLEGRSEALTESFGDKSIAVLPFVNMSSDQEQEYFSDGLTDTLIHGLAQVSGLRVTAKTSSFYFKGMNVDISEIARKLNVSNILEGSVQKSGNRVRITAQLIEAHSDTHLWSQIFDRDLGDIFAIQDEIAREVMKALEVKLIDSEQTRMAQRYQPSLEAYEQLILGRHEVDKRTAESLAVAERHFKRAIELAPDYALAYVGLAETYDLQIAYGNLLWEESLELRQPLVDRALELAPLSGEAHLVRASLLFHQQLKTGQENSSAIDEEILRAIELSPNSTETLRWYSGLLYEQGRHEEALAQLHAAAELDPLSQVIQTEIAAATWDLGRAEEAMKLIRQNIERTPEFPNNYERMARYQSQLGHLGEAQRWLREARRRNPDSFKWWLECLGFLGLGEEDLAAECANELDVAHPDKIITDVTRVALYEYQGNLDAAISILESLSERLLGWPAYSRWLADMVAEQGDIDRARSLMASAYPEFLEEEIEVSADWYHMLAAVVFAAILEANGETPERDRLLLALEDRIASMHRIHGEGYGMLDVYIHTMRGDRDQAIAGLREAFDMGWKFGQWLVWYDLRKDWKLASLHDDPEFITLMDELEAEARKERQWYEENRDKPLF